MDIESLTDAALKKLWDHGIKALDARDQLLVTIWGLEAEVNNGGFDQYYFNSYGDQAVNAPIALLLIGANQMADLVAAANAAFGQEGPSEDRSSRLTRLEEIRESATVAWEPLEQEFWRYPDDLSELLRLHLESSGGAA